MKLTRRKMKLATFTLSGQYARDQINEIRVRRWCYHQRKQTLPDMIMIQAWQTGISPTNWQVTIWETPDE